MCENCKKQTTLYENVVQVNQKMGRLFQRLVETLDGRSQALKSLASPSLLLSRPLSKAEAQDILQISESTIGKLLRRGDLPYFRVGRQVRIKPEDLNSYLSNLIN
jgi:excisionase family DNA binding protein